MEARVVLDGVPAGYRDLVAWGRAAEVEAMLALLRTTPEFVAASPAKPSGGVWVVRVRLRDERQALPGAPLRTRPSPPWWWPTVRDRAAKVGPWLGLGLAVTGGLGWLLWQAAVSTARWAGDHTGQLVTLGLLAASGGGWWLLRRLRKATGCPGVAHCTGCNGRHTSTGVKG